MSPKVTRRELAVLVAGTTAAAQTPAQQEPDSPQEQMKKNAALMNAVELPITVEPAFLFKA